MRDPLPAADLITCLEDPASYPYTPEQVEVVQTHASYVALVPPFVYKVKKPVDLGFLDFSTLERRQHYCEVEVAVNSRLCAPIYEGVVALTRQDEELVWEGDGEPVEYAVKMRHLDADGFLHRRLERGEVRRDIVDRVVAKLSDFYRAREPGPKVAEAGRISRLHRNTDENFEQTKDLVGDLLAPATFNTLRYYTDRFYDQHAGLLNRRRVGGRIVDGHGDLHLEHIHLSPQGVCIYDAIEFNERFRHLDVACDVAFLAMDLDFHGRADLSRYFVDRMASALRDVRLPMLVDFYKVYRAYVRAKVEGMRSVEGEVPERERDESRRRARRYYQLALRYAVAGSRAAVVVVMGRTGTGKSAQAAALHEALGWSLVASDHVRKQKAGVPLHERGGAEERDVLYARRMTEEVYEHLAATAIAHVAQGQCVLIDATYSRRVHRDRLRACLEEHDVPCFFVELTAPEAVRRERLGTRGTNGTISDARLEDMGMLDARYETPDALEDARHFTVDSSQVKEATTETILNQLVRLNG